VSAGFTGFPAEAAAFYVGLEADNSRAFWQAHKVEYELYVRGPMECLLAEVDADFGPFHIFRPHNDVRFSKTKVPYKTAMGAVSETEGGAVHYVQFSATGLLCGSGYYAMASDQLDRFRRAVVDDARGTELAGLVAAADQAGYSMGAISELKTAPRGYDKCHPRIEIIRRKGLIGTKSWPVGPWLHTKKAKDRVVQTWIGMREVNAWLDAHVGPSTSPPEDAWR